MSNKVELKADSRSDLGKGASRRLRRTGKTPAIVYGLTDPVSITLTHSDLWKAQESEAFYSSIINVNIDGKANDVVVKSLQRHPAKSLIMHIDFQRIDASQTIIVNVPIHYINGDISPAVKLQGGQIQIVDNSIKVECLPNKLPEYIEIDLGNVNVDEIIHISNITLPEGVTSVDLAHDHDLTLVQIVATRESAPGKV
jgi:large subunit ribosomal protein L25